MNNDIIADGYVSKYEEYLTSLDIPLTQAKEVFTQHMNDDIDSLRETFLRWSEEDDLTGSEESKNMITLFFILMEENLPSEEEFMASMLAAKAATTISIAEDTGYLFRS